MILDRCADLGSARLTPGGYKIEIQIYKLYEKYQFIEKPIKTF
jgi:hypothetical protein